MLWFQIIGFCFENVQINLGFYFPLYHIQMNHSLKQREMKMELCQACFLKSTTSTASVHNLDLILHINLL